MSYEKELDERIKELQDELNRLHKIKQLATCKERFKNRMKEHGIEIRFWHGGFQCSYWIDEEQVNL